MTKTITDPFMMGSGVGVMVLNESGGRPSRDELAVRGDYPPTPEQVWDSAGRFLQLFAVPLAILAVSATVALGSFIGG